MTNSEIDKELLARVAAGSKDDFRVLFDAYAPLVHRYARLQLDIRESADEIVQETMLSVWQGRMRLPHCTSVTGWIFTVAKRRIADYWRRHSPNVHVPLVETSLALEGTPLPDHEAAFDLRRTLSQLDRDDRELLYLVFYCGLRYSEASTVLDVPIGTVKSRVHHLRKRLKVMLGATDGPVRKEGMAQ